MLSLTLTSSQAGDTVGSIATVSALAGGGTAPYSYGFAAQQGLSFSAQSSGDVALAGGSPFAPIVTIWDGGFGGNTVGGVGGDNDGPAFTGGTFNLSCTVRDAASNVAMAIVTINGADRSLCYFNADADADLIAASIAPSLIPAYLALTDGVAKAQLLIEASTDVNAAMRYQGRRYDTIDQVNEFPRVAYEPSNAILPNTGAAGIPGGSAFGSTIWDIDAETLNIIVPARVLFAVIHQANYLAVGERSQLDDQHFGTNHQGTGGNNAGYDRNNAGLRTALCRRAYLLLNRYRLSSGRLM